MSVLREVRGEPPLPGAVDADDVQLGRSVTARLEDKTRPIRRPGRIDVEEGNSLGGEKQDCGGHERTTRAVVYELQAMRHESCYLSIAQIQLPVAQGFTMRAKLFLIGGLLLAGMVVVSPSDRLPAQGPAMTVYKTPTCGCCASWVDHMKAAGFKVQVQDMDDLTEIKQASGVPIPVRTCHAAVVGGYVSEGHVPAGLVKQLRAEKPKASGIAVPGMPVGSPDMESGNQKFAYDVLLFGKTGKTTVYAKR